MKITDIKPQVKRQDRYSIYIDGKYTFSLSANELIEQSIKIEQVLSEERLAELKETAVDDKAYMRAVELILRRQRSTWEMEQYLKRKGYNDNTITKILNMLSIYSLLDDRDFACSWVENRRLLKNTSKRRLWQELKQKHVSDSIIAAALENDEVDEKQILAEVIKKKRTQTRYQNQQKLIAYLLRQGFNYGDIKTALAEV